VQLNSVKVGFYTLGNLLSPIDLMYVYHLMYCCGHRYFKVGAPVPTPKPLPTFGSNLSNSNKLFNFAEKTFPEFFSPSGVDTFEVDYDSRHFIVRYYADSNTYIGTVGGGYLCLW
jgi:hypothetical protein